MALDQEVGFLERRVGPEGRADERFRRRARHVRAFKTQARAGTVARDLVHVAVNQVRIVARVRRSCRQVKRSIERMGDADIVADQKVDPGPEVDGLSDARDLRLNRKNDALLGVFRLFQQ